MILGRFGLVGLLGLVAFEACGVSDRHVDVAGGAGAAGGSGTAGSATGGSSAGAATGGMHAAAGNAGSADSGSAGADEAGSGGANEAGAPAGGAAGLSSAGSSGMSAGAGTSGSGGTSGASAGSGGTSAGSGGTSGASAGSGGTSAGSGGTSGASAGSGGASAGSGGASAGSGGSSAVTPPSCASLATCGSGDSCCTSLTVTGGTFNRSYDGVTPGFTATGKSATVATFKLDKYEVTVGRFRKFVSAWIGGYRPAAGDGKHTHLNSGQGLVNSGPGGYESGWSTTFASGIGADATTWNNNLACEPFATWTNSTSTGENRPINCLSWEEAYAFCIWDGGFLPSDAEWNYTASNGADQRVYPWSSPFNSTTIDATYAAYSCLGDGVSGCAATDILAVGSRSPGNGYYGHADLSGNVTEWALDWMSVSSSYSNACTNCAYLPSGPDAGSTNRVFRGGAYGGGATDVRSVNRYSLSAQVPRSDAFGARCARSP